MSENLYDFTFVARNPINNKYYAATHSFGILEFTNGEITDRIDEKNWKFREVSMEEVRSSYLSHCSGTRIISILYNSPVGKPLWLNVTLLELELPLMLTMACDPSEIRVNFA